MHVRIARFEGVDVGSIDEQVAEMRRQMTSGELPPDAPAELQTLMETVNRFVQLVDRDNGVMLGLTPREAAERYDQVIEFAELEDYQDLKLKNYSSGMHVRLAFSVAIQVDASILLIDEVLAVGDAAFQQKCFDVFNEMRDAGRTILLVTHDMNTVTRFCHRAMLLERGEVVTLGDPKAVGSRYLELNFGRVSVTEQVVGYARKAVRDGATLDVVPLLMPEVTFETEPESPSDRIFDPLGPRGWFKRKLGKGLRRLREILEEVFDVRADDR